MDIHQTSFFQICLSHMGFAGWLMVLLLVLSVVFGIGTLISVSSKKRAKNSWPLPLKLILCCVIVTVLLGVLGFSTGMMAAFAIMAISDGPVSAKDLAEGMMFALVSIFVGSLLGIFQMLIFSLGLIIKDLTARE